MMNRLYPIALLAILLFGYPCATFAQDTVFNRVVTVERDYQPEVQEAQAIATTPTFIQYTPQLNPVVYSTYSEPLSIGYNLHALPASKTHFRPNGPDPLNGVLDGAVGHRNSHFLFGYRILPKNKTSLDLYANHDAYWGKDALSQSAVGLKVTQHFRRADLYFDMEGKHDYWHYLVPQNTIWGAKANIGIVSKGHAPIQYRVQTGYQLCFPTTFQMEHQVRTIANIYWTNQIHAAGINATVQNFFYTGNNVAPNLLFNTIHAIRLEPFYELNYKNIHLHAGVNLNMNIDQNIYDMMDGGTDPYYSSIKGLGFAPSPNIQFSWHTDNNIFHVYANSIARYGANAMSDQLAYNRFLTMPNQRTHSPHSVEQTVGIKLRPVKTLLLDLYGGHATHNQYYTHVDTEKKTYQIYTGSYYHCWKVGASLHYHYRDIIEFNAAGNYYFWDTPYHYDRPDWDAQARLDVHITSKWSLYSENYLAGSRWADTSEGAKQIKPMISLNLGGQYIINRWLSVYLQLNDYLNRRDEIVYGYHSQGIHFLLGVKYKF